MVKDIDRLALQRLMRKRSQLLDVLPAEEYREYHLPGALHVSLKKLTRESVAGLDRSKPTITYCFDSQ